MAVPPTEPTGDQRDSALWSTITQTIQVLVIDDERLVRDGLQAILDAQMDIHVVQAVDGVGASAALRRHHIDVVLCDVRMPVVDGLAVLDEIVSRPLPRPTVAMLSTYSADDLVSQALRRGAAGYLLKDSHPDRVVDAVRQLAAGASVLSPAVTAAVIEGFLSRACDPAAQQMLSTLSPREQEVLALVARGEANQDIAASMHLSLGTIKDHVSAVLAKMGVSNRVQATLVALRAGGLAPKQDAGARLEASRRS